MVPRRKASATCRAQPARTQLVTCNTRRARRQHRSDWAHLVRRNKLMWLARKRNASKARRGLPHPTRNSRKHASEHKAYLWPTDFASRDAWNL